jgi:hypothetical protein
LAARLLDVLVLLPVLALMLIVTLLVAAPDFGPIFPRIPINDSVANVPAPGFIWVYVTVFGCLLATGLIMVAYETVATACYGRTLGKAWMHIRPLRLDGIALGWGRAFGRVAHLLVQRSPGLAGPPRPALVPVGRHPSMPA